MRSGKKVLHVGLHKTGTTSFQAVLQKNKKKFEENGVSCPSISAIHENLTYPHVYRGQNGFKLDSLLEKDCHSAILSDEDIIGKYRKFLDGKVYPNARHYVEKVRLLLEWESLDLWICLRDYGEWLESCYLQKLKGFGEFFSFQSYYAEIDFESFSWIHLLDDLSSLSFVDKVHVVFYEKFKEDNNIMYRMVENCFGVKDLNLDVVGGKRNPSISDFGYQVLSSLKGVEGGDYKKLNRILLRQFSSHHYGKPKLLTSAENSLLSHRYNQDVEFIKNDMNSSNSKLIIH